MARFYREAFGFEPAGLDLHWSDSPVVDRIIGVKDSAARVLMLKAATCFLELFQYSAPAGGREARLRPFDRGYTHFCVEVQDIHAEYRRLSSLGMTFANPEPVEVGEIRAVYGWDPEGNLIEIQEVTTPTNAIALEQLGK
jgi:catechol 2,3-dioxygenase-like lactoylglutathione lyase family enzyme